MRQSRLILFMLLIHTFSRVSSIEIMASKFDKFYGNIVIELTFSQNLVNLLKVLGNYSIVLLIN